ncbi:hypothetical protein D3C80_1527230 [compost metagenome]
MQTGQTGAAQNCPELLAQQLRTLQAQANSAHAQKRIGLAVHWYVGQRFVAAHIQRAHHQIALWPKGPCNGAVSDRLLVMAGRVVALKIKKLRTQQTDPLAA